MLHGLSTHPTRTHSTGILRYAGISFRLTAQESASGNTVTTFDQPLQLTVLYDLTSLDGIRVESLRLYFWDEDSTIWRDVVTTCADGDYVRLYDPDGFRVPLCHQSEFSVLG